MRGICYSYNFLLCLYFYHIYNFQIQFKMPGQDQNEGQKINEQMRKFEDKIIKSQPQKELKLNQQYIQNLSKYSFYQKIQMQNQKVSSETKCQNCEKLIQSSKIDLHERYCIRNFKRCDQCAQMYDVNYLEEHLAEFHQELVKCSSCKKQISKNEIQNHKKQCGPKLIQCIYCDLQVPQTVYSSHFVVCESRTRPCQHCQKQIQNKDYIVHEEICLIQKITQHQEMEQMREKEKNYLKQKQGKKNSVAINLYNNSGNANRKTQNSRQTEKQKPKRSTILKQRQIQHQEKRAKQLEREQSKRTRQESRKRVKLSEDTSKKRDKEKKEEIIQIEDGEEVNKSMGEEKQDKSQKLNQEK